MRDPAECSQINWDCQVGVSTCKDFGDGVLFHSFSFLSGLTHVNNR